jgi:hypothetical protein
MLPSHRGESRAVIGATTGFADNRSGISKHRKTFALVFGLSAWAFNINLHKIIQMMST